MGIVLGGVLGLSARLAEAQSAQPSTGGGDRLMAELSMFAMLFLIFYLLVMRPQQRKLKAQQDLLSNLKKGDNVITSAGIIGRVAGVESDHVVLEVAPNVRVKVETAHIAKRKEAPKKDEEAKAA